MRGEWVTTEEAAKVIGCCKSSVHQIAKRENWEIRLIQRTDGTTGLQVKTFRRDDAKRYAVKKEERKLRSYNNTGRTEDTVALVEWADSLDVWPSDEEIMEHVTDHYRYPDIVSVLWNREERQKKFKWTNRPEETENEHQSNQRETAVGVGASI